MADCETYVGPGEVSTLKHEAWDDAVEDCVLVGLSLGATLANGSKVLSRPGDDVVKELKVDAAGLFLLVSVIPSARIDQSYPCCLCRSW
jgi:hypothetical protein